MDRTLGQQRPYVLIESDVSTRTLGEGTMSDWPTLREAVEAFVRSPAPYKQVIYDDDVEARELNADEQGLLKLMCEEHGLDVEDIDG
jgi:hypothetical protein